MTLDALELALSLLVLAVAGDQLVLGLSRLATSLHMRPTIVGALIGGLGTSLPELVVVALATAQHNAAIAVGSAVGSIIANVALCLGIAALVAPVMVDSRSVLAEAPISVGGVLLLAVALLAGLSTPWGVVLGAGLVVAVSLLLAQARLEPPRGELATEVRSYVGDVRRRPDPKEIGRTAGALALSVAGAELLVHAAVGLAAALGISQGVVGLTMVAIGTSAPLLASSIQAARRGNHDLVIGNVVGGNLFIALGTGMLVAFLGAGPARAVSVGATALMAFLVVLSWWFMRIGHRVTRLEAGVLLASYVVTLPVVAH